MHKLAIIVPFFNQYNGLKTTLDALAEYVDPTVPVYFLNMGSADGSAQLVNDFRQPYHLINCTDNTLPMALFRAHSLGSVRVDKPTHYFLCKPGVEPNQEALEILMSVCDEDGVATASPLLTTPRGLSSHTGTVVQRAELVDVDQNLPVDHPRVQRRYSFKLMRYDALMIKAEIIEKLGFREEVEVVVNEETGEVQRFPFTFTFVDYDFTLRAHRAGYENIYEPKARMLSRVTVYPHQTAQMDMVAFYNGHGDIAGVNAFNDAKEYYGTKIGNFPAIEHWQDKAYEGEPKPKIYVILADHEGCGTYRLKNPFRQLIFRGYEVIFSSWVVDQYGEWADVIVMQRQVEPKSIEFMERMRKLGKKIIFEIDDFFHGLPDANPAQLAYKFRADWLRNIELMIYKSDALIVSTPELKNQYGRFNTNTYVVPNHTDVGAFPIDRVKENASNESVRIGWAGTNTHDADMLQMVEAMTRILADYPQTTLVFMGNDYRHLFPEIPLNRMDFVPSTSGHEFPVEEFYELLVDAQLDIGLAPLANNLFNRCKSDVKLIEYGALGIVPVASDVEPYSLLLSQRAPDGTKLGFLARSERDWYKYVARLIEDPQLRHDMGLAILQYVWNQRNVVLMADIYEEILDKVMRGEGHRALKPEPVHSLNVPYLNNLTAKQAHTQYHQRLDAQRTLAQGGDYVQAAA